MPRKEGGELMPDDLNPNKNIRRKGLFKGRPNIVEDLEDENNEDKEIFNKPLDRMSKGGLLSKHNFAGGGGGLGRLHKAMSLKKLRMF